KVVVVGVVGLRVEAEFSLDALETDFRGIGGLDLQIRIADFKGARGVVGAMREQFERGGRALYPLQRQVGDQPGRQILDLTDTDARVSKAERLETGRGLVRGGKETSREYAGAAIEPIVLDARREHRAEVRVEPQLVVAISGGPAGARLTEQAAGVA